MSNGNGVNGGSHSGGCASSVQSDASSWEAVDEKETKPTLWVPDHAVSSCMRCRTQFWFGRRKHHCRSCGQLFCSECSDNLAPIPSEQLYHPVRICDDCFQKIYPEEAAKKLLAAECATNGERTDAADVNFCQKPGENLGDDSNNYQNGITNHTNIEQTILQKMPDCQTSINDTSVQNNVIDNNSSSDLPNSSDINNLVIPTICTTAKDNSCVPKNEVLEGEACVILSTTQS